MDAVWIALIAAAATTVSVVSPLLMAVYLNRARRKEKEQDWKRQDLVAANLLTRQDSIAAQTAEAARLLVASDLKLAATAKITLEKLDVIHTLVNSTMTAALQDGLDATVRQLSLLREVVELKRAAGKEPLEESVAEITATQAKIAELRAHLNDRVVQQGVIDREITAATRSA